MLDPYTDFGGVQQAALMQDMLSSLEQLKDENTVLQTACNEQQTILTDARERTQQLEALLHVAESSVRREQQTVHQLQVELDAAQRACGT